MKRQNLSSKKVHFPAENRKFCYTKKNKNWGDDVSERRYLIGEVSKIMGISKDTLRFWDKIGLLKPKYVDPENCYRYYTYDQFWSMDIIMCCRSLNQRHSTLSPSGIFQSAPFSTVTMLSRPTHTI